MGWVTGKRVSDTKDPFCTVPVLAYKVPEEKFILDCDAVDMVLEVYIPKWSMGRRKS